MPADREERNRVLGVPVGTSWQGWVGDEQQRVLGFPADWLRFGRRSVGRWLRRRGPRRKIRPGQ